MFFKQLLKKNFSHKKSGFDSIYPVKSAKFAFYVQFKKHNFGEKHFLEKPALNVKFFQKSMILNDKVFVKSMILNENFFGLSFFKTKFLQRVRF